VAVDTLGRFVFVLNRASGKISMFHIDPATGALLEVPASPFSAASAGPNSPQPTFPSCLAVEPSGQFLYVGCDLASDPGRGAIQAFQIDSTNLQLLPLPTQFATDLDSSPIGLISIQRDSFVPPH
jgi:6-phosphogluconolactonase (cycloisomerase 2 family)